MNWAQVYEAHGEMRAIENDPLGDLRQRLVQLAARGHVAPHIRGRFTQANNRGDVTDYLISPNGGLEPLAELSSLADATLLLMARVGRRRKHLHQFTAMVEGTTTDHGLPWAAAVHLESDLDAEDADRKGSGACGHAAFHCHVGPTLDHDPKVRLPLPPIGPVAALDWLLTMIIPDWEPARWASLVAMPVARR